MNSQTEALPDGVEVVWETNGQYVELADSNFYICKNGPIARALLICAYTVSWPNLTAPDLTRPCAVSLAQIAAQRWSSSEQVDPQ